MEPYAAALLIFIILANGFWSFGVKHAIDKIGLWNSASIGFGVAAVVCGIIFLYTLSRGAQFPVNNSSIFLAATVMLATLAILALYFLLENQHMSIIIPLVELYIVVAVLLGVFVLKEQLTIMQIIGIVFAIAAGILLSI